MNPNKKFFLPVVFLLAAFQGFCQDKLTDHLQFTLHFDPLYSNSKVYVNPGGEAVKSDRDKHEKAKLASVIGLNISYIISKNLKFTVGGYYTNPGEKDIRTNSLISDTSSVPFISTKKVRSYKYFGAPFLLTYTFTPPWKRPWLFCITGGLCAEKYYDATEKIYTKETGSGTTVAKGKASMTLRGTLASFAVAGYLGAGYERQLSRKMQLCIMPYYKYYFTKVFVDNNGATNSRLKNIGLNLSLGYRITHKVIR